MPSNNGSKLVFNTAQNPIDGFGYLIPLVLLAIEFSQRKQAFGGPTPVGKTLDKSRPPEHRWRYPKPQLFSEVSIDDGTLLYHGIIWECSVFMDNCYPVADSEVWTVIVFPSMLVDYSDVPTYPDIVIQYSILHETTFTYANGW